MTDTLPALSALDKAANLVGMNDWFSAKHIVGEDKSIIAFARYIEANEPAPVDIPREQTESNAGDEWQPAKLPSDQFEIFVGKDRKRNIVGQSELGRLLKGGAMIYGIKPYTPEPVDRFLVMAREVVAHASYNDEIVAESYREGRFDNELQAAADYLREQWEKGDA